MPPRIHAQTAFQRTQPPTQLPFSPGLYLVHTRLYTWLIDNGYMYRGPHHGFVWRTSDFARGIASLPQNWDYTHGLYQIEPREPMMSQRATTGIRWISLSPATFGRRDNMLAEFAGLFNGTAYSWATINLIT